MPVEGVVLPSGQTWHTLWDNWSLYVPAGQGTQPSGVCCHSVPSGHFQFDTTKEKARTYILYLNICSIEDGKLKNLDKMWSVLLLSVSISDLVLQLLLRSEITTNAKQMSIQGYTAMHIVYYQLKSNQIKSNFI